MFGAYTADMAVVDRFRFFGKPKEVSFNTQTASRIPGVHCKFHRNEIVFNGRKTVKIKTKSRNAAEIKPSGKDIGKLLGLLPVNSSSHCSGSSPFQKFTARYVKGLKRLKRETRLPECSLSLSRSQERTGMVEGLLKSEQWQKHLLPEEQDTIFSDASKQGWGEHLNLAKVGGQWNWEEKVKSHINWLELKAAVLALQAFLPQLKHQHVQIGIVNKTAMTYISKVGGTRSHRLTSLALEMWNFAANRNLTSSAVYVPGEENQIADKRSRVFLDSLEWMLHPAVFQASQKEVGCFGVDLFALRVNHQVPAFVSWRSEPGAVATDAFNVKWDFQLAYLFSPFCMIKRCLRKIQQDQSHCVLITPVWKSRPWYPVILSLLVGQPLLLPRRLDLLRLPGTKKYTPVPSKKLQAGCMTHFRAKLIKEEFSQKVSDILLSSWRKKTASQYESAWKAWSGWCSEREFNPFSTTLENILEFLADLFYKGFKFRTLGVYRSAISSNHETVDGFVIGKHPMMAKFMKGVFSLSPPEPKYFVTWDVRQVLDFLKICLPAESLSLKQLTLKGH